MKAFRIATLMALIAAMILSIGAAAGSAPNVNSIIINPNPPYQSSIWSDRTNYSIGDRIGIGFRVNKDSYAYVFSIDATGVVRLIFPNIYSSDNKVKANRAYSLPDNNKYNFTIGGPAGTDQLVLISTPNKIDDTDWLRRSLQQNSFAPQVNINIAADGFMAQIKSVIITPVFKNDWSSAYATYTIGGWINIPTPVTPPVVVVPPVVVNPPVINPPVINPVLLYGRINVSTNPAGAKVYLNGVDQGSSPSSIASLRFGEYEVTVVYPGYYTATRRVQVNGTVTQNVSITMDRIADRAAGTAVFTKLVDMGWPSSGPVTEGFSYYGYNGSINLRADMILGMISRILATANVQGQTVQFAELTGSGQDAAYVGKVVEYLFRPFTIRLTVVSVNNVTGSLTGASYIESIRIYIEVFYVG